MIETLQKKIAVRKDRAVSPVIGVILMVAITVILAAVIGTFVLQLGGNVQQNAQAGVTFQQSGSPTEVSISVNSIQRADAFTVLVTDDTDGSQSTEVDEDTTLSVGSTLTVDSVGANDLDTGDKITVIAHFEGNENVIGEYTVK